MKSLYSGIFGTSVAHTIDKKRENVASNASIASGKPCTFQWSVIATAGIPHLKAVLTATSGAISASIVDIVV